MRRAIVIMAVAYLALAPAASRAAGPTWEPWLSLPGALDVDGPRTDGQLVATGSAALYLVDPAAGAKVDFARGPGGYRDDAGLEAFIAMSPGGHVVAADCDFGQDETYVLRQHFPFGITRVDAAGEESGSLANIPGVTTLTGIAFDTVGGFDHRLLVLGGTDKEVRLFAVDCNGGVKLLTTGLSPLEGGMAVAPMGFGSYGGRLIIPDERRGRIVAIASNGQPKIIFDRGLTGPDRTFGGLGFVPPDFISRGGSMYVADRKEGGAFPGTDNILRMQSTALAAAGVQDGDLLVVTEDGGRLVDVRCTQECTATFLSERSSAHAQGHLAFTMNLPEENPTPAASPPPGAPQALVVFIGLWGIPTIAFAMLVAFIAAMAFQVFLRRGR